MKHITMSIVMLAVLLFIAPLTSAESAPAMYFVPENGTCNCGEENTVDLMVNTSEIETVMQAYIYFDPQCVNVTGVNYTGSPWQPVAPPGWKNMGDYVTTGAWNTSGVDPGVYKYVTLTIECVGCECTSPLEITDTVTEGVLIYNGTFRCNESQKDAEPCLGSCYADSNCTELVAENISCCECVGEPGYRWKPNLDESCFGVNVTPFDLCLDYCPECSDCDDNDGDNFTDYPADNQCTCGLDPSESESMPPIPELPTSILMLLGLAGLLVICCVGSIRKKLK